MKFLQIYFEIHIKPIIIVLVLFQVHVFSMPLILFPCLTINMILYILFFPTALTDKQDYTSYNAVFLTGNFVRSILY